MPVPNVTKTRANHVCEGVRRRLASLSLIHISFGALMMEQYLKGKLSPENELRAEEFSNRVILYGNEER